jgi:hypothetical protein
MCTASTSGFKSVHWNVGNDKSYRSSSSVRAVVVATIVQSSMQLLYIRSDTAHMNLLSVAAIVAAVVSIVFTREHAEHKVCSDINASAPVLSSNGHIQSPANDLGVLRPSVLRASLSNSISTSISCVDYHPRCWACADTW